MTRFAVDTGPIVAFLNSRDSFHKWTLELFGRLKPPLYTCEAVLSEANYLVQNLDNGPDRVLDLLTRGVLTIEFGLNSEANSVRKLMAKYADVPMSLADACLVRMTEIENKLAVITFDSDFNIYRRLGRQVVPVLSP